MDAVALEEVRPTWRDSSARGEEPPASVEAPVPLLDFSGLLGFFVCLFLFFCFFFVLISIWSEEITTYGYSIILEHSVIKFIGPLWNLFHLESRPSALKKHLPKALFKLAVWKKEVGNVKLLATIPIAEPLMCIDYV